MQSVLEGNGAYLEARLAFRVQRASQRITGKNQWVLYRLVLLLVDAFMLTISIRLAYSLRFDLNPGIFQGDRIPSPQLYQGMAMLMIPAWLVIYALSGLYNRKNLLGGTREYARLFNSTIMGVFLVIARDFLQPDLIVARGWLLISWALSFLLTAIGRFWLRRGVYAFREQGYFLSQAVIVGANDEGLSLASQLMSWKTSGFHLLGFIDKKIPPGKQVLDHLHCLGSLDDLEKVVKEHGVEEIILATSAFSSHDGLLEIFKAYGVAPGINVRMSSGLYEIITTGLTVNEFAYVPLVEVNPVRLSGIDRALKLFLDYSLAIPGLCFISPLLLALAIAIKLDSPGPIIYRRRVMGLNGRQFDAFKFRTMVVNGDEVLAAHPELKEELARNHKLKDDPRVTRVGHYIRKLSLDELPQVINVIRGEMSLVGPRMISPGEMMKYDHWDINLLTVRPGITGLWQVSGRSDITYTQRVRLDMHYIRNWTIWLDLQLLFQTIPAVLKKRGAY